MTDRFFFYLLFLLLSVFSCDKHRKNEDVVNEETFTPPAGFLVANHDGSFEDAISIYYCNAPPEGFVVEFNIQEQAPVYEITEVSYLIFAAPAMSPLEFVVFESGETPGLEITRFRLPEGSGQIGSFTYALNPPVVLNTASFFAGLQTTAVPDEPFFGLDISSSTLDSWGFGPCLESLFGSRFVLIDNTGNPGHVAISIRVNPLF